MDRTQVLIEADKRGLLNPEQKAELDTALKGALTPEPGIMDTVKRVPGLVLRGAGPVGAGMIAGGAVGSVIPGVGTVAGGLAGGAAMGITQGIDALTGRDMTGTLMDKIGIPRPETPGERIITDVAGGVGTQGAVTSGGRLIANAAAPVVKRVGQDVVRAGSPVAERVGQAMAANPAVQTVASAGAAGAGGAVREGGGGTIEQFAGSLMGGVAAGGAAVGVKALYDKVAGTIGSLIKPTQSMAQINVVLNQILEKNGIDTSALPTMLRAELAHEVRRSMDTGRELNPDVMRRIADYGVVGATPTRARVTLTPADVTQEKNLSKIGINTTDPKLQQLANIENENNKIMIAFLNERGAGTENKDPVVAGRTAEGVIQSRDARMKAIEDRLYGRARDKEGRQIQLDAQAFVTEAYNNLAKSNNGAFLPGEIKQLLLDYWKGTVTGPDGKEVATPFNVDAMQALKTKLATASRGAKDGNVKAAISDVYNAIENVQPRATGRPATGGTQVVDSTQMNAAQTQADATSAEAMAAFDRARNFARGRRTWQESTPGIEAALKDPNPDNFIQNFVIGGGKKGQTAEVEKLLFTIKRDPQAFQAVQEHVFSWLKQKALSGASDEVGAFSQSNYNSALNSIGEQKLKLLFTPEQIVQLKTLGRVASYEMLQPKGSAVNNSNSAALFFGFLDKIANLPAVKALPLGESLVSKPAANVVTRHRVNVALDPAAAMREPPPSTVQAVEPSILDKLFGPGVQIATTRRERDER